MDMQDVLTTVGGVPITVRDVADYLKSNGTFRNAIYSVIENRIIAQHCQAHKIRISDQEFYEHAETKRRLLGLLSASDINRYCKWHGIVMDQWSETVRQEILRNKLKDKVIRRAELEAYFASHQGEFAAAYLSRIVCGQEAEAASVKSRAEAGEADFAALARQHSVERNTRVAGGFLGLMRPAALPPAIAQAVFAATRGAILGPFAQSEYWAVYRVEDLQPAALDDALAAGIKDLLFTRWLQAEVLTAKP